MGRAITVNWVFQNCECLNVAGELETIPAGIHAVTEQDVVTVKVGTKTFDLDKAAFKQLRAQGKVNHLL